MLLRAERGDVRGEESPFACEHGDEYFVVRSDFVHGPRELVVEVAIERIVLLGHVERDDGYLALVLDEDAWFRHVDGLNSVFGCNWCTLQ